MQSQVTCPQCSNPFTADIHQVIDTKKTPQLKQALLNGQLNLATCPSCGFSAQLQSMLLFHDPDYEIFMVHVPPQLNLDPDRREQMIGQMTQQVMAALPQEERRAYMFQPEIMLNFQTFMERVLETEGISKEMIALQKQQSELLKKLIGVDSDVADHLIQENMKLFDQSFFSMLQMFLDQAIQMNDSNSAAKISNLRAQLMTKTATGKEMERQQIALHKFNQAAKKQSGLTQQLLLDHLIINIDDIGIIDGLVATAQQGINYEFFALMTAEIEKREKAKDVTMSQKLTELRDRLVEFQKAMQAESQQMVAGANQVLEAVLAAPDKKQALADYMDKVDEAFMYVLSNRIEEAQKGKREEEFKALAEVQAILMVLVESQLPPEIQLLNQLVRAQTPEEQAQIMEANQQLLTPEIIGMMDRVIAQAQEAGQAEQEGAVEAD